MLGSSVRLNCPSVQNAVLVDQLPSTVVLLKKSQGFPTRFVIPIETINGKPFGSAFLDIGRFSAYSKQPCSAQEHSQADHCKGYRNSTATHVSPTDSCLTERETYLEPPISGRTSPAGWRQLYVSDIKPYGCHSRRGHRRTACFHTPLVKPKRGPTARTCTRGRYTFRLPSRRWRWAVRSDHLVVWQIRHAVLARVERKITLGLQQLVLKARTCPKIGQAHGRL